MNLLLYSGCDSLNNKTFIPSFCIPRPPNKIVDLKIIFLFSIKPYVVGNQKNHLNEMVLLSTQNKCLNQWIRKYSQFYSQKFGLSGPMLPLSTANLEFNNY